MISINNSSYPNLDAFFNALPLRLARAIPLSLDLGWNHLDNVNAAHWQVLCTAIQMSQQPITLSLIWNNLNKLDASCWQALCTAIQMSQQPLTLDLDSNHLEELDAGLWQDLCTAMQMSQQPITLDLSWNNLYKLDASLWQALCTAMQMSQQPLALNLRGNFLNQLGAPCWQALCTAIQMSQQPLKLNLGINRLDQLDGGSWQALCTAIQMSRQPLTLSLEGNELSPEKITSLKEALLRSSGMHKITVGDAAIEEEFHRINIEKRRLVYKVAGFFQKKFDLPDDAINLIGQQMVGNSLPKRGGDTFAGLVKNFAETPHVQQALKEEVVPNLKP